MTSPKSNAAQSACLPCRRQKLRCTKDLPICLRCKRLNKSCEYPDPTQRRNRPAMRHPPGPTAEHSNGSSDSNIPHLNNGDHLNVGNPCDHLGFNEEQKELLLEIFFKVAYHSNIMFHRPSFIRAYKTGGIIAPHTILAMWATALHFIDTEYVRLAFDATMLASFPDGSTKVLADTCAERAKGLVLPIVDNPTIDVARTCCMLSTYALSKGRHMPNAMFNSIAWRASRALHQDSCFIRLKQQWLDAEFERRILWTCWWSTCVNNDHYLNGSSADIFMLRLHLPCSATAVDRGINDPVARLLDTDTTETVLQPRMDPWNTNVNAELSRVVLHWTKIQDHIVARFRTPALQSLTELLDLEHWLDNWWKSLSAELRYSKDNFLRHIMSEDVVCYCLIPGMFYLSRMTLHASVVPQFSGQRAAIRISPVSVRASAELALNSANEVAMIASDILDLKIDPARFPPLFGHCMYVAATIQMAFISSGSAALSLTSQKNLIAICMVLKLMKPYWSDLRKLWVRIHLLYEAQVSRIQHSNEPIEIFRSPVDEINNIAITNRDTGRLEEPISDSVLQYGHRTLKDDLEIDETSFTALDLENRMRLAEHDENQSLRRQIQAVQPPPVFGANAPGGQDDEYVDSLLHIYNTQIGGTFTAFDPYPEILDWSTLDINNFAFDFEEIAIDSDPAGPIGLGNGHIEVITTGF